jgi:uncharacterized protein
MTPEERQMIANVFDRMRAVGRFEKDQDAETFINQSVRQIPDSAYLLIQSVLVQEQALAGADERIRMLEGQVASLEAARAPVAPASSGGFLGGLFGGSKSAASVPVTGRQSPSFGGGGATPSPWGNAAGNAPGSYPGNSGGYQQQPQGQPQYQPQAAAAPAGGGFMKQAMTTAAGVAGGMLAANAIGNMMRGGSQSHDQSNSSFGGSRDETNAGSSQTATPEGGQWQDANNNDPGTYDNAAPDQGVQEASDSAWGSDSDFDTDA